MKKVSNLTIIAVAIIFIVCVVFYYEEVKEERIEIPTTNIVVATKDIPENTIITKDMVKLDERYTKDLIKEKGNVTQYLEKVVGKRTRVPLFESEAVNRNRLIENKPYMEDLEDKKIIEVALTDTDKAQDLKAGDFIDIWLEPNKQGMEVGEVSKLLFEKQRIVSIDNAAHSNVVIQTEKKEEPTGDKTTETSTNKNTGSTKKEDNKVTTPMYFAIELTNDDIVKLLDVKDTMFDFRVVLYGEDKMHKLVGELIEKNKPETTEEATLQKVIIEKPIEQKD